MRTPTHVYVKVLIQERDVNMVRQQAEKHKQVMAYYKHSLVNQNYSTMVVLSLFQKYKVHVTLTLV